MALSALCCAALLAACSDSTSCAGVGESCQVFCCANLSCHSGVAGDYCTKGCRCRGSSVCAPSTFEEGCPQGSACLARAADGTGECVQLCDRSPCRPGQLLCTTWGDAGIGCSVVPLPDLAGTD